METERFWRKRESRFRRFSGPRLYAIRSDADGEQHLDDLSARLLDALRTTDDPLDDVARLARSTGRVGSWVLRNAYVCRWNISADSHDSDARRALTDRFRDEAALAARAADLAPSGASDDEAAHCWCDARVDHSTSSNGAVAWIEHLAAASKNLCAKFAGRAWEFERIGPKARANAPHPAKRRSDERTLGRPVAAPSPVSPLRTARLRRAAVDAYIDEVFAATGVRITRTRYGLRRQASALRQCGVAFPIDWNNPAHQQHLVGDV
jgi:hypothetical protein